VPQTGLGTVTIVLIRDGGVDRPFAVGVAILQIVAGLVDLGLLVMYRRANRVNESAAVPPRGRRATELPRLPAAQPASRVRVPGSTG
jgi:hypothetical protein